jgi:cell division septation protein DedD
LRTIFFIRPLQQAGGALMAIEQLEKVLVRYDPVAGGSVVLGRVSPTSVHEQRERGQKTPWSSKNWPRIHSLFDVGRAGTLLRLGCGVLVLGAAAYLGYLVLVDKNPRVEQTSIRPPDQQQAIVPLDQQQATISSRSMHDAPPEEGSSYNLTSTPPDVAIESLKSGSAVSPRENSAVPANDSGGYVVQVSAERSDAKAQSSFKTLQSRYPHVLGNRSPLIRRVELGKKGIFYRAQIGPFDTVEEAKQLCARLKSAGGHCMVQKIS